MFVDLPAKKDFAPLGAKQSFRTYGAGLCGNPNSTNISLLTEQNRCKAFLTWRVCGLPPLFYTATNPSPTHWRLRVPYGGGNLLDF